MGLFFPEDPHFDEKTRQTGFYRYRQLPWRRESFTQSPPAAF